MLVFLERQWWKSTVSAIFEMRLFSSRRSPTCGQTMKCLRDGFIDGWREHFGPAGSLCLNCKNANSSPSGSPKLAINASLEDKNTAQPISFSAPEEKSKT